MNVGEKQLEGIKGNKGPTGAQVEIIIDIYNFRTS